MIIRGKVAIVTGGGQGIGKEFVRALLLKEAKVAVLDWNKETGLKTVNEFAEIFGDDSVHFIECDVSRKIDMERSFTNAKEHFGRLNIVVNNAGVMGETDWERTLDINLKGTFGGTVIGMQLMGRDKGGEGGVIVNMSSLGGVTPAPSVPAYVSSKHGVIGLSRSFGGEEHFAATGIRVNCICPWVVQTEMGDLANLKDVYFSTKCQEQFGRNIKEHGFIQPETVAEGLISIIEDDSKNGEVLMILQNSAMNYIRFQEFKPDSMP